MIRISVWASGGGSNAKKLLEYFENNSKIGIAQIVTNKTEAGVVNIAKQFGKEILILRKEELSNQDFILKMLTENKIDIIVLAGFLLKIPNYLVRAYSGRIINIHPSLLPKYGGKGMYGMYVHEAVKTAGEIETGITIHLVNEYYDEGRILFQKSCELHPMNTATDIALKVQALEHQYFGKIIEQYIEDKL